MVIATKFIPRTMEQIKEGITARQHIETCLNSSLKRLEMDYVDLYILHMWDYNTPVEETMEILHEMIQAGKVKYIGIVMLGRLLKPMKLQKLMDGKHLYQFKIIII